MDKKEVLIWIEPFAAEMGKFNECLVKGVGMNIIAVSTKKTIFPTIIIPDGGQYAEYVQLAAGWNILVETGISLGIDLINQPGQGKWGMNIYRNSFIYLFPLPSSNKREGV